MDFDDDRSIFSNSQMALDINMSQNDLILPNYDDAQLIQYYISDVNESNFNSILSIPTQCEQQPPHQNVQQQSSNSLKAQNHQPIHTSQQTPQNRSHNLNHPYQSPQSQNQFHNNQAPTSKQQFLPNLNQINQQQINYVNIPNKDNKSIVYQPGEVVNQHNMLNSNSNCVYKKEPIYQDNHSFHHNGINHQQPQVPQQQLHQRQPQTNLIQQQNSSDLIKTTNNLIHHKNQTPSQAFSNNLSPNNLSSINKNGTNSLMSPVSNRDFYHSPPNYYSQQQPQPQQQPQTFIQNHQKKNIMNGSSNLVTTNYFNDSNCNNNNNIIKLPINSLSNKQQSNSNSINSNLVLTANDTTTPKNTLNKTPNKSQPSELNNRNSSTVDFDGTKKKAETKTVILFKIVDQILVDGNVIKETIIKNDEIIKHTGWIDWPQTEQQSISNSSCNINSISANTTETTTNKSSPNLKKSTTPKSKNLKRSVNQNNQSKEKQQEKRVKTEIKTETKDLDPKETLENKQIKNEIKSIEQIKTPTTSNKTISKKETSSSSKLIKDKNDDNLKNLTNNLNDSNTTLDSTSATETSLDNSNIIKQQIIDINLSDCIIEEPIFKPIDVNQRVLAKWNDKCFYHGTVISKENDSKWRIGFDDGGRRLVRANEIISVEFLPINTQVMVSYSVGFVAKGVIRSHRLDSTINQVFYLIEHVAGSKFVKTEYNAKDIFLTNENALILINRRQTNMSDSKFADVDLNNIIPKRSRISIKNLNDGPVSGNSSLNNSLDAKTAITNELEIDNDSNSNLSSSTTNSSTTNSLTSKKSKKGKTTIGILSTTIKQQQSISSNEDNESSNQLNLTIKPIDSSDINLKLDSNKPINNDDSLKIDKIDNSTNEISINDTLIYDNLIGPIPEISLFKSFAFLLSFEDEKQSSEEVSGGCYSIPFDIEHLTKQITCGSGLIIDKFEDIKDNYQVVLVCHSYHQSIKYMMCLSSGIPILKFTWIIDSCKKNELLKKEDYILPSGFSLLTNNLLQDRTIYKKSQTLFKGTKIFLVTSPSNHELNKWLPLFNASKAILLDNLPDTIRKSNCKSNCPDLIVADSECPKEIVDKANSLKIHIVSIVYIIQCIIHGKRLHTDAHPSFHYLSSKSK